MHAHINTDKQKKCSKKAPPAKKSAEKCPFNEIRQNKELEDIRKKALLEAAKPEVRIHGTCMYMFLYMAQL